MSRHLWAGDLDELLDRCLVGTAAVIGQAEQLALRQPL
jgi:hypothetical protein